VAPKAIPSLTNSSYRSYLFLVADARVRSAPTLVPLNIPRQLTQLHITRSLRVLRQNTDLNMLDVETRRAFPKSRVENNRDRASGLTLNAATEIRNTHKNPKIIGSVVARER
jgi:hypothetical protein